LYESINTNLLNQQNDQSALRRNWAMYIINFALYNEAACSKEINLKMASDWIMADIKMR